MKPWTTEQRRAFETRGKGILVSAAAGSGKTAVLAERCADLVCNARHPCNVNDLLVVTFTESAANQMKSRIRQALRMRGGDTPSAAMTRQLTLVEHANVSTLHGFCARLIRQNFNRVELDPDFQILDEDEAVLLANEIVTDLFQRRYENDEGEAFARFVDHYGDGKDENLMQRVIQTHNLLRSLADSQKWVDHTLAQMAEAAETKFETSALGKELNDQIRRGLSAIRKQCELAGKTIKGINSAFFASQVEAMRDLYQTIMQWQEIHKSRGLDALRQKVRSHVEEKKNFPPIKAGIPEKELVRGLYVGVRDQIENGPLAEFLACSSAQWQEGIRQILPDAKTFLSLVQEFGHDFSAAKAEQRAVDFSDLEHLALRILRDGDGPSSEARALHKQFKHVLVDEYQDINEIQDEILRLVSHESTDRSNNLFYVGDAKQSIYGFRLADPRRFLDQRKRFGENPLLGMVIDLRDNFRSRAPLLAAINDIFQRLMISDRTEIVYDSSQHLQPGKTFPAIASPSFPGAPMEMHLLVGKGKSDAEGDSEEELEREEYEAILVAKRIRQMMGMDGKPRMNVLGDKDQPRPIEFGDIVILLRAMQHKADAFADILQAHGIPVFSEAGNGFFQAVEVRDMICLLEILDNARQDIPLAAVLRSPLAGIPNADDALARIRIAFPAGEDELPFHEAVAKYSTERDDELAAKLRDVFKQFDAWRDQTNKRPLAQVLWDIYEQSGYLAFCAGLEDGEQRVANLLELHRRAGQFGTFLRQGLYRFLRFLQGLREQKDIARPPLASAGQNVVRIMSIHRSKGLEFPVVFLPDLGKTHNLQDAKGRILADRAAGLGMKVVDDQRMIYYSSLPWTLVHRRIVQQTMAEELRLLYVGLTRAKEHVVMVGTCSEKQRETWSQWSGRSGELPEDAVLGGMRVLDWLVPIAEMTANAPTPPMRLSVYDFAQVSGWKSPRDTRPPFTDHQQNLAELKPLPTAPPPNAQADAAIRHFNWKYSHEDSTHRPASASVTSLSKTPVPGEAENILPPWPRRLDMPRFFVATEPKATDIGTATHLVLEHWDFSKPMSSIETQIESLIDRRLISSESAKLVDRHSIQWMLGTPLGKQLSENHNKLLRELPFAMPANGTGADATMVRGRIDLLLPTPEGLAIVDYKTDNVKAEELKARVETYRRQMEWYRRALEGVAHQKIAKLHLVFLKPQCIETV